MANPDCGAVTREPPKPQYEPNQSTATRFKRCMIDRCPQCLQCRRILQRVKPRSFAFDKAHTRPSPGRCACRRPPRRGRVPRAASPFRSPSRRPGRGHWLTRREYVDVTREELEAVAIESKRTIEIEQFVPKTQIDELYIRDPYYIAPDGEVGQQAFAVIREAIRKEGMVAVGKVVFTSREHIIALEARDSGMLGMTLRYPYEVRTQAEYFDEIPDEKVPKDMLDLALHIVDTKRGDFEPEKFQDQYEDALRELIEKKAKGEKIEQPKQPARSNVVNLMDALRASVEAEGGSERRKPARQQTARTSRKPARGHGKHKKAS